MYEALNQSYSLDLNGIKRNAKRHRFQSVEVMKSEYRELLKGYHEKK